MSELNHPFLPIFNEDSKVLVLGSFPSVISRERDFYYANPQNRFWRVLENLFDEKIADEKSKKIEFLLKHKIAIYDVALSCEIVGSADSKIKKIKPINLEQTFKNSNIRQIFANGNKSYEICTKFLYEQILNLTKKDVIKLPSTSSANAKFSLEKLIYEWRILMQFISHKG